MSKSLRIIAAMAVVLAILLLARSPMAWAQNPLSRDPRVSSQPQPADRDAGTVKPPPVVVPPVNAPGTYSVGGVCTFIVTEMADAVSLHANLLPYATLGQRPDNISSYVAGVCQATFVKSGVGLTDLAAADGVVKVCFATVPNTTTKIYVYDNKTWTALETTVDGGLTCAPAQQTGKYVLVIES